MLQLLLFGEGPASLKGVLKACYMSCLEDRMRNPATWYLKSLPGTHLKYPAPNVMLETGLFQKLTLSLHAFTILNVRRLNVSGLLGIMELYRVRIELLFIYLGSTISSQTCLENAGVCSTCGSLFACYAISSLCRKSRCSLPSL